MMFMFPSVDKHPGIISFPQPVDNFMEADGALWIPFSTGVWKLWKDGDSPMI
ncbi:hypothetical protein SAMN05421790_102103 [Kroppenstedtia eburnea]|uniref:Uncharacterized protein n=1 Tax=Kroppenstedtia eburnea TaxID=714067 RepID=A0A1N7JHB6_9BACL|nr:hypothetical protein SAMN05421790_102103 [Kroppenstedtia eburnea]